MDQTNIFEFIYPKYHLTKPIRLIEMFSGYGSQALALKYLGVPFEHWKICEWNYKSFQAYRQLHMTDDTTDYSKDMSKEDLIEYLASKNISADWNKPMKKEQIKRLGEDKLREIYNNIQATHNLVDISQVHGNDLEIINPDQYTYIMTYSFPCQDLSLAGLRQGMNRGEETRSGLLWEVERILHELQTGGNLPDILLMENVPQVHGAGNEENFRQWQLILERMGYSNYWQDLIATDYGIPQIRNRCFMVSIKGEYCYNFPSPIPLKKKLKNLLEKEVDEKYYLSEQFLNYCVRNDEKQREKGNGFRFEPVNVNCADTPKVLHANTAVKMHDNFISYPKVVGGVGEMKSNNNTQYYMQDRIYEGDAAVAIPANESFQPYYATQAKVLGNLSGGKWDKTYESARRVYDPERVSPSICTHGGGNQEEKFLMNDLRIRKLTPAECFRLMGVKDEDSDKLAELSNSTKYHLAGDSIVTTVLMAIFGELLEVEWKGKVNNLHG